MESKPSTEGIREPPDPLSNGSVNPDFYKRVPCGMRFRGVDRQIHVCDLVPYGHDLEHLCKIHLVGEEA